MTPYFGGPYGLALFIVRILVLPVIIGCGVAPALLRSWKGANRSFLIAYQFAVATTIISLVFDIAYIARYGDVVSTGLPGSATSVRPLIIFGVFVGALDLIYRIATFIVVTQLAIALASSSRRKTLQIVRTAVATALAILFVLSIAFDGRYADVTTRLSGSFESLDPYGWVARNADVNAAFFAVYLLGVATVVVAAISSHSWPLRAALIQLLIISILALASAAGNVSMWRDFFIRNSRRDYNVFAVYWVIELILETFLQTGILVVLLFGTQRNEPQLSKA